MKLAMQHQKITMKNLSLKMHLPTKVLQREFRHRDVGVLKVLEFLQHIEMQLDVFIELTGYYHPGAASDPSAWK